MAKTQSGDAAEPLQLLSRLPGPAFREGQAQGVVLLAYRDALCAEPAALGRIDHKLRVRFDGKLLPWSVAVKDNNVVLHPGDGGAHKGTGAANAVDLLDLSCQDGMRDLHRLFKVLVRVLVRVPAGIEGGDGRSKRVAAAGIVLQVERLDKMFVKIVRFLSQQCLAKLPPQKTEGGVWDAVFAHRSVLLVVVKPAPADVKSKAVKALRQSHGPHKTDVGAQDPQQGSRKNVVGVEFSRMGIGNLRNLSHQNHSPFWCEQRKFLCERKNLLSFLKSIP